MVLNGRCAADDVEVERDVVLEEIAMRDDDPEDAFGGHVPGGVVRRPPGSVAR